MSAIRLALTMTGVRKTRKARTHEPTTSADIVSLSFATADTRSLYLSLRPKSQTLV